MASWQWPEHRAVVLARFPALLSPWRSALSDEDLAGHLIGDLLKAEAGQSRSGSRPALDVDEGLARYRELFDGLFAQS